MFSVYYFYTYGQTSALYKCPKDIQCFKMKYPAIEKLLQQNAFKACCKAKAASPSFEVSVLRLTIL